MRGLYLVLACALVSTGFDVHAQRRGAGRGGSATLAIFVTDPSGSPVPDVNVTVDGPATRSVRTEAGRIALEGIPSGNYRLRFDAEGYVPLERELTARSGAPIDVKVTLTPLPPAPAPPQAPTPPEKPAAISTADAEPAIFDVPAVFEKEFVGRAPGRSTPLACGVDGTATLIQVREPIAQHAHPDSDEFLYVIGGEGRAQVAGRDERLKAGLLLFVPRGVPHALSATGRNPLVLVSTQAGEGCER